MAIQQYVLTEEECSLLSSELTKFLYELDLFGTTCKENGLLDEYESEAVELTERFNEFLKEVSKFQQSDLLFDIKEIFTISFSGIGGDLDYSPIADKLFEEYYKIKNI
jgi:hypothetical protein